MHSAKLDGSSPNWSLLPKDCKTFKLPALSIPWVIRRWQAVTAANIHAEVLHNYAILFCSAFFG
jgi:hypothetical protein